jgi:hypothetical protein
MSEIKVNKISPRSGTDITLGDSGDNFIIPSGATLTNNGTASGFASIAWQSSIVTGSTLTAVAGNGYWIDTTLNACTVTLPGSASVGDQIIFVDYARTWGTNTVTLNLNSLNYQGGTVEPVYDVSGQTVNIVYSGATKGWIPISDDDVTNESIESVNFLVIGGGGGASKLSGGAGGAGGYRNSYLTETSGGGGSTETPLTLTEGEVYTITVGAGGSGGSPNGSNGTDSSISGTGITTITSSGGGAGGREGQPGSAGGSGGGGGGFSSGPAATGGSGTANQGFAGGAGAVSTPQNGGGGGGGASAVGSAGTGSAGGNGGDGLASSITGSSVTRAGGGGGSGKDSLPSGTGGAGGGGDGNAIPGNANAGQNGTANTGGGGGGSHDLTGGSGGSGVVILRISASAYSGTTTGSPTVDDDGSFKVLTYTGSGSYTA